MTQYAQKGLSFYEQTPTLYDLALSVERPPQSLPLSPASLLSLFGSVIDLLIEHQISATLWSKLPSGEIWQSEIQRYHKKVGVSDAIYTLYSEKLEKVVNGVAGSEPGGKKIEARCDLVTPIQLAPTSQLRREYFLLVLSPQFCSIVLAHRHQMKEQAGASDKTAQKKIQPLLALCSFEKRVIDRVLDGIKHEVEQSTSSKTYEGEAQPYAVSHQTTIADLLANWDSRFICPPASDAVLLEQLLAKQIQQHDEIRHSATTDIAITSLQLQNKELLNTLSLKDEVLSNLCQELRTPLTNMKTALSLLNSSQLKPPQRQRYMQLLNTECDRQNSLIAGFLDLVELDRYREQKSLQPVRLSDIVPGVVSTYQPLAQEKGITLAYTVPTDLPVVSCLDNWLKQIVINLLHNSIKFTQTGGKVWVRARPQGNYVQLEFRDTGTGIPLNEIPKIFDRFYRVRPVAGEDVGGAGLGLTIVQQILWRCGGSISVRSKLGEGSTFNVLLPIAPASPPKSVLD